MVEVRNSRLFENRHHILKALIHMPQMIRQMVGKQTARPVSGVELHRCLNVPLHAVRVAVIADGTKGLLVAVVEAIRARKRLNQILVFKNLVEVERIDPLRVKACEHLIHDNQKIQLLLRLDTLIRFFVCKPRCHIFLELVIAADVKALPVARVVVLEHRFQALFFVESLFPALVVNGRVKKSGHAKLRIPLAKLPIVAHCLRNAVGCKNRMKFAAAAQCIPVLPDMIDNLPLVLICQNKIPERSFMQIVLNSLLVSAVFLPTPRHRHIIQKFIVNGTLLWILQDLFLGSRTRLMQCDQLPELFIRIDTDHQRVKAEHIPVANAVRNAVAMQLIAENITGCAERPLIFRKDRRSRKAKKQRIRKSPLNRGEHVAECRAVALVNDEHDALALHLLEIPPAEL